MPTAGKIAGTVREGATPVAACTVRLYDRTTGALISSQSTGTYGEFLFSALDETQTENFFVVALDPAGGTQYNAMIYDRLTPVTDLGRSVVPDGFEGSQFGTSSTVYGGYHLVVLADSPVAYWQLNDTAGSVLDSGPNALHGAIQGTVGRTGTPLRKMGGSFVFTRAGRVTVPHNALLNIGAGAAWSVEYWVRAGACPVWASIVSKLTDPTSGSCEYRNTRHDNANIFGDWEYTGGPNNYGILVAAAASDTNYHVVYVRDTDTARLYMNGILVASKAVGGYATRLGTRPLEIGGNADWPESYDFGGQISDVALYNYALSAAQVTSHYSYGAL